MRARVMLPFLAIAFAGCGRGSRVVYAPAPTAPGSVSGTEARVQAQAEAAAPKAAPVGPVLKAFAQRKGEGGDWAIQLEESKCYWFSVAADPRVVQLEVALEDGQGRRVLGRKLKGRETVLDYCPPATGSFRIQARARRGGGELAVGVFAAAAPPKPEPELGTLVDAEAAAVAAGAQRSGSFYETTEQRVGYHVTLTRGNCYFWVGVGRPVIESMEISVLAPGGRRLAQNRAAGKVSVGYCPRRSGMYRFQVAVGPKAGPHAVGLYTKPKELADDERPAPAPAPMPAPVPAPTANVDEDGARTW